MKSEKINFKNLVLDQLKGLEELKSIAAAELTAILYAAIYQNDCLIKIINTKMTGICPSIASEAFTVANEVAEKIEGIRSENRKQDSTADQSGAV